MDEPSSTPQSPQQSLEHISQKMESLAVEYNAGKINHEQFVRG